MTVAKDLTALAAGLEHILRPSSVAVIGASRRKGTIGFELLRNLIQFGFQGPVYPVNPNTTHVLSLRTWPTVEDIPDPVDLAVIVVPKPGVLEVVRQCAKKGVKGLVVISAGFKEVDEEGRALEAQITEIVRQHGMRMVGPNCMGVVNTDPAIGLGASFGATQPVPGTAAFASQSGGLGEVILATAKEICLGISQFVSLGNKADVSSNDLLAWWATDPNTQVILLYLESFGNPRNFSQLARKVTREHGKPILAVKSGRSSQGALAASSHTGSLAGGDRAARALFAECGVIRCSTVRELFDRALGFCYQPPPPGNRVAILTNAGGPGIMAIDAAVYFGLEIAAYSEETRAAIAKVLPREASVRNPVDMIASAGEEQYRACAAALLADPNVDALLPIFVRPLTTGSVEVAQGIVAGVQEGIARAGVAKPVLACLMGGADQQGGGALLREAGIPNYPFPEAAAETLSAMAQFQRWQSQDPGRLVTLPVDRERARRVLQGARARGDAWLSGPEAMALLDAYGIPTPPSRRVATPEEAIAFAEEVGFPVVLKLESEEVVHKSDVGGVQVDVRSPREIKGAFWDLKESLAREGLDSSDFLVQKMVTGGRETIIGAVQDPTVGHLLMFGLGGVFVELMEDVAFRVHPLTDADARRMIDEVQGSPLLKGYRGAPEMDLDALEEVLLRVSQLVGDFPEIAEMDLNPFLSKPAGKGSACVDVRVRLEG
ncbi:MAG: acetate--CoA ligase family protein [Deltaproteobacteria bacterium]|nr:acetate--CoA ligase family protein [Deltaproteobacteria bacterium]